MTAQDSPWPLDLELVGICGNDYESLAIIGTHLEESHPEVCSAEILARLRELQSRGWMMCYRYVLERIGPDPGPDASLEQKSKQWRSDFVPVPEFPDAEAPQLWWASTDAGIAALKSSNEWNASGAAEGDA